MWPELQRLVEKGVCSVLVPCLLWFSHIQVAGGLEANCSSGPGVAPDHSGCYLSKSPFPTNVSFLLQKWEWKMILRSRNTLPSVQLRNRWNGTKPMWIRTVVFRPCCFQTVQLCWKVLRCACTLLNAMENCFQIPVKITSTKSESCFLLLQKPTQISSFYLVVQRFIWTFQQKSLEPNPIVLWDHIRCCSPACCLFCLQLDDSQWWHNRLPHELCVLSCRPEGSYEGQRSRRNSQVQGRGQEVAGLSGKATWRWKELHLRRKVKHFVQRNNHCKLN